MTRETKIGLLVGLAFIIVIGILLSDHLSSSTEPPSATMSQAGATVRNAVNTPVRNTEPPVVQVAPPQVTPTQPVPTAGDLQPRPQPVKFVQVNGPAQDPPVTIGNQQNEVATQDPATQAPPTVAANNPVSDTPTAQPMRESTPNLAPPTTPRGNDPVLTRLNQEANRFGEQLVPVGGAAQQPNLAAVRKYKVEPGDTLSSIATKMYGTANKAAREAIVAANPSLKDNPNLVIEGRTYTIPTLETAAQIRPAASDQPFATPVKQDKAQIPNESVYVVKEGDNLTRIANEMCGTATAVAAIKELNRDLLNGSDVIRPGMKLKLPAKSVAVNQ